MTTIYKYIYIYTYVCVYATWLWWLSTDKKLVANLKLPKVRAWTLPSALVGRAVGETRVNKTHASGFYVHVRWKPVRISDVYWNHKMIRILRLFLKTFISVKGVIGFSWDLWLLLSYYPVPIVAINPIGRILVRWQSFTNNLQILVLHHPISIYIWLQKLYSEIDHFPRCSKTFCSVSYPGQNLIRSVSHVQMI